MFDTRHLVAFATAALASLSLMGCQNAETVRLMTLDPGHFHAALMQKTMYPGVEPLVHVYAPGGAMLDDLHEHLKRIEAYNQRDKDPTRWREVVYTGPDYFEKMLSARSGNVVVIAGNNQRKTEYILKSVQAGINVLADKPMAINPAELVTLKEAYAAAKRRHVALYDIMTERFEIWTILQRELMQMPEVFGELDQGTPDDPAIVMESVHYFSKTVSGTPLKRPAWFFDVRQEGEGLQDVGTHLIDLVQWEAFPDQFIRAEDVNVLAARRWPTPLTRTQFARVTGGKPTDDFPAFLKNDATQDSLNVYANGIVTYSIKGTFAKVTAKWDFETPNGGDTHYSMFRGTKATLIIRQGAAENYKPTLYAIGRSQPQFVEVLHSAVAKLAQKYPGISVTEPQTSRAVELIITVPQEYDVGHEAHFASVAERFLEYLRQDNMPPWEGPNTITKYATLAKAYELSHK